MAEIIDRNMKFDNRYLKSLIFPLMLEQLLAVSVGFVDTLMVSTVGEAALSGVALVDNINRLVIMVFSAFATGGIVIVSQYYGRGEKEHSRLSCGQLITLMEAFSLIILAAFLLFARPMLSAVFGKVADDVMDAAVIYLVLTSISYPFLAVYNSGAAIFRSFGNSKISMKISFVMNLINVLFNAIFVFIFNMGVAGVGLATLISRVFAAVVMWCFMNSDRNMLRIQSVREYMPKMEYISRILKIGVPSGIENGMFQIGKLLVVSMVATLGTSAIAANSVAYQIIDFPNIPGVSIGLALVTISGQCMGAGDVSAARYYTKKLIKTAYICDWICKGLLFISAPFIVGWFSLSDVAAAEAVKVLRAFFIAAIVIWPLSFTLPNSLRAAGDVRYTMCVSIASMWICRIAASYLFVFTFNMGLMGVWLGMFVDWYVRGVCYILRFIGHRWEKIKVI